MYNEILRELEKLLPQVADQHILPNFNRTGYQVKDDNSLITAIDTRMQNELQTILTARWPQFVFLGEEMTAAEQASLWQSATAGIWCLDPLDGTSNYAMGVPFFSVSLALVVNHEVVLGLVYDPVRKECFSAQLGTGARLNGKPLQAPPAPAALANTIAIVDFKRLPTELACRLAASPPYRSQRSFGSVALDWCWIAAGRGHVYLHGRQKLWDYGAGRLILSESGGYDTTLERVGEQPLDLKPRSSVAALDYDLFQAWCQYLGI